MKIKMTLIIYALNILAFLLLFLVFLFPESILRLVLGLPFIFFSPGFVFVAALYPRRSAMDGSIKVIMGLAASVAIVPLICFLLYFTPWGIRLNPILVSVTGFIVLCSLLALIRSRRITEAERPDVVLKTASGRIQSSADKIISLILVLAILGSIGVAGYVMKMPKAGEKYTEFYILGKNKEVKTYPSDFTLGDSGTVTLSIVNHEGAKTNYRVEVTIDGTKNNSIEAIDLNPEEKYENSIRFTPQQIGDNQKVEFLLYKNGQEVESLKLHLLVNVE